MAWFKKKGSKMYVENCTEFAQQWCKQKPGDSPEENQLKLVTQIRWSYDM